MSKSTIQKDLFAAAKQLVDSEIELLQAIEDSKEKNNKRNLSTMSQKKSSQKSGKSYNVRPSAALIAAKKEAAQQRMLQGKKSNNDFVHDIYQKAIDAFNVIRTETGLVYDYFMAKHQCLWDPNYPECPDRLMAVIQRCTELGLVARCKFIAPREATEDEILLKHTQNQIDILKATNGSIEAHNLELLSSRYDAIYIHPTTYKSSLLAAGSTINLVESICRGEIQNGMAIIRPPGHHAMKAEYCGYCFFNNVAIAAESALRNNLVNKILIIDWDVHHGQATQQMFYSDPRVVYFSIHRYENGEFWPNLRESDFHFVGDGLGEGYNFNVPLNKTGMTNADYLAIFQQILLPMAYEFQPDLVLVSAGYDAAFGCPEGEMLVTPACYSHLLSSLMSLASGKVAVILEGGYCIKSLAESAALTLRTLLGDPCPMLENLEFPSMSVRESILNTVYAHKPYWKCYQFQDTYNAYTAANNKDENLNHHMPVVTFMGFDAKTTVYETRNCYPVQSKETIERIEKELKTIIHSTNLSTAPNRVCVVYDDRMLEHCHTSDETHPEKPNRIKAIYEKYQEYNLFERCYQLQGRSATVGELLLAHSQEYIDEIETTLYLSDKELQKQAENYNSIYLHSATWTSACISAGSLLQVVDSVLSGDSQSGVAIVRPPGHHASEDIACGFCIFNNIAIAAKYAIEFYHLRRIMIVDWDVHHGNGTQSIFEEDDKVLYVSVHRYDYGNFFPHSTRGNYTYVGAGVGKGRTVNIPWNKNGMGDAEYIAAFQQIVMPIAYQFNPELILVSAGFDACIGDPFGGCSVSPEMYGHLTHWLSSLANGRVILSLEGGYNINSIAHAMAICTKSLLGDPLPKLEDKQVPCTSAITTINNVLKTQKQYWPNLVFNASLPKENVLPKAKIQSAIQDETIANEELLIEPESKALRETKPKKSQRIKKGANRQNVWQRRNLQFLTDVVDLPTPIEKAKEYIDNKVSQCPKECANGDEKEKCSNNTFTSSDAGSSGNEAAAQSSGNKKLYDYLLENSQALVAEDMFAVIPLSECPHLGSVKDVPSSGINTCSPCEECGSSEENWICLQCYTVHCGRDVNQHGVLHATETDHPLTLSFSDLSVWCYKCESYIDNPRLYAARNAAHCSKFNEELPWTYNEDDFRDNIETIRSSKREV